MITRRNFTPHRPFPIADTDAGMYSAKEPWLSPQNAFSDIRDGFTFRSRLRRRAGFERFAQTGIAGAVANTAFMVGDTAEYQVNDDTVRIVLESCAFTYTDAVAGPLAANVVVDSFGFQTWNSLNQYGISIVETGTSNQIGVVTQQYTTSAGSDIEAIARIRWVDHSQYDTEDPTFGTMTCEADAGLPLTGLFTYRDTSGEEYLFCTNTTRLFLYSLTGGWFQDSIGSDEFTGAEADQFWMWPFGDYAVLTNGINGPYKFTGSTDTLAAMTTTIGAGPDTVQVAKLVILYRNRLIYLNTTEAGDSHPRRARWSGAGAYETFDVSDFGDAPSELGTLVTVQFIADRILVGFEHGWMELVYTEDSRQLFRWEKTTYVFGANAKLGSIADGARILARSENGITALDPNEQYAADIAIPDYVLTRLDHSQAEFTSAFRNVPDRQFWWSVVNSKATTSRPNEILVSQYQEDSQLRWAVFDLAFNCFTQYRGQSTPTWDDININWDDDDVNWDSASGIAGFPLVIAGHTDGSVYRQAGTADKINDHPLNEPDSIPFKAVSERLSPFPGERSHLGWVDLFLEASASVTLEIQFRGNTDSSTYKSVSITVDPSGANSKVYKRITVNKSASFHMITIKAIGSGSFIVDAIIPWFRPAGHMKTFG